MKKIFLIFVFALLGSAVYAQNKAEAERLVQEGIDQRNAGNYEQAIAKYDQALQQDKDNFLALSEKSFTLEVLQEYDEAITCCKKIIELHGNNPELGMVYVVYGNSLDAQNKRYEAIGIYDEGIKKFPDFYKLYFNKGVTLTGMNKYDDAIQAFQTSISIKPDHPGSHNALAILLTVQKKPIPSLLASGRFLILEPIGTKAIWNLDNIRTITAGAATKTGKNSISINLEPRMLGDTTADGKPSENSFSNTEFLMSLSAALFMDKKYAKYNEADKFALYLETLCASLRENQSKSYGFYWSYYVPFFLEMEDKKMLKTFSYIAFASSDDKAVAKWISEHNAEITAFYKWAEAYKWPS